MNTKKFGTVILTAFILSILGGLFYLIVVKPADNKSLLPVEKPHVCIDSTHSRCDGECECDGFGCPPVNPRSYQIQIVSESILAVYDRDRLVGHITLDDSSELGSLIMDDNR